MITPISNEDLLKKCREHILQDPAKQSVDELIKTALVTANREIAALGGMQPLGWLRTTYDELFTHYYAAISAITAASPGVITADSMDPDIGTAHGFSTGDLAYIHGIVSTSDSRGYELNDRVFRVAKISDTTLSLKSLESAADVATTTYQTYDSGGYIYHAGITVPTASIEPTTGNAAYKWKIKRIWGILFDGYSADPISEEAAKHLKWNIPGGIPQRWRYWRQYQDPTSATHFVHFHCPPGQKYNVKLMIEKGYPDLSTWSNSVYPPHPPEVHDFIWHRALAILATNAERARRQMEGERPSQMAQIEVLYAQKWLNQQVKDEIAIHNFSKELLGQLPKSRGWAA